MSARRAKAKRKATGETVEAKRSRQRFERLVESTIEGIYAERRAASKRRRLLLAWVGLLACALIVGVTAFGDLR